MNGHGVRGGRWGMTLLEVMLALALLLVLSAGVMGFFYQLASRRDQLVRLASQQRDVSLFFDRLDSALLTAVTVGPDGSAGIVGDATSLTITARSVTPAFGDEASLDDACVVSFAFQPEAATCSQSVAVLGAGRERRIQEPLMRTVERLRFRYSDGKAWRSRFDSLEAGGLPVAVEVSVWFEPRTPRTERVDAARMDVFDRRSDLDEAPAESEVALMQMPAESSVWTPREPDHVRIVSVPDAPAWQERLP